MVSEVIAFILLSTATIAASALVASYMAAAASQTTTRINEQAARQVLMASESLTMAIKYACSGGGSELCIDVMNNSGREIGISYVYDQDGMPRPYRILDSSGKVVSRLPVGSGTIVVAPGTITAATLISENSAVYRIS